jgi:DNA-binding Lrp family transcriptional regulator
VDAFVYLRVRPGRVEDVVVQLENVTGVRAAVAVVGAWDVLAAVQGPDLLGISEEVVRGIHLIEGVERTMTAPVVPRHVYALPGEEGTRTPIPMQEHGPACFVHVKASPGAAARLADTIAGVEEVSAVAMIAGDHDLIVEIPFPWEQAAPVIVNRLRPIDGIEDTRTLVAILFPGPDEEDRDQFSAWS